MNLSNNFDENIIKINNALGIGKAFDVSSRPYTILNKKVTLYFLAGLIANIEIIEVMKKVLSLNANEESFDEFDTIYNNISHQDLSIINTYDKVINSVLNGIIVLIIEGYDKAIAIATRSYPTRGIAEPDTEKVIRGSHDGFTENFAINVALMRRRVKDGRLRNVIFNIGSSSPTYVCLSYIEGLCDEEMIKQVKEKLENIKTPHLIMTDKALEELMLNQKFNPYPLVRYTERADIVSIHLYQGSFAIFVDTSPSVILAPATIFDHLTYTEEYRQTPISGSFLRIIRYGGVFISLFLTPVWLLLVMNEANLPSEFSIFIPDEKVKIGIFIQIVLAEVGVELLRMASIHTPTALSTAMGLVAGMLLGDVAIQIGIFSIQTVFLVAISAVGTYITPSYELGLANKISKLLFLVVIFIFNIYGFIAIVILWFIYLATRKSFTRGYLYPLIPFNLKRLIKTLFRTTNKEEKENAKIKM